MPGKRPIREVDETGRFIDGPHPEDAEFDSEPDAQEPKATSKKAVKTEEKG